MDFDWWLRERTFHHSQFSNPEELEKLKVEQGLTISLIFPTLNEEKTIARHIRVLKKALLQRHHLVDEIGIVDSGSVDRTREIAKKHGIKVFLADECLPELMPHKGKGENLWKSLYLFKGDILVWVDADIRNIHPRFVYGLIGPILFNPEIGYVKAFYRRPLRVGHKMVAGGGRVTELLVRPFLNLLYPDLAMLAQPLSGEYAGRRSILERLPFFTGYGVEMGLLIDIEQRFGIRCIAQVDMDVRVHRNQGIESLRRMSYVILSVLMRRSEQLGKIALLEGVGRQLHLIRREGADYFYDAEEIRGRERPPILSVPAYQEKYGILAEDAVLVDENPEPERLGSCVTNIISESFMKLDLLTSSREEAISELLDLLFEKEAITKPEELLKGILQREKRVSTNVGRGVALPHMMTEQVDEIIIVVGRSKEGIDFSSHLVRRPVHVIFLMLSPPEKREDYLQTLACLARLLRNRKLVQDFLEVPTPAEAVALLKKYEALIRLQRQLNLHPFSG